MPTPPTASYVPSRCQAQYAVWIRGGTEMVWAPQLWTWEHPEPGCYRIYPNPADVGADLAQSALIATFHVDRSAGGGLARATIKFNFNSTATPPPLAGQVRLDNIAQTTATAVRLSYQSADAVDVKSLVMAIKIGNRIVITDDNQPDKYQVYDASADAVDMTSYGEVAVAWVSGGNVLTEQAVDLSIGNSAPAQAGTLISEIEQDCYTIWTFDAAGVMKDIGVAVQVSVPGR
jgi:hypothetical protein